METLSIGRFVLVSLAVWRVTHLLAEEDGPGDVVVRLRAREPEADQDEKGDEIGDEGVGEAGEAREELLIGLGVEALRQLDIDDQQGHREV